MKGLDSSKLYDSKPEAFASGSSLFSNVEQSSFESFFKDLPEDPLILINRHFDLCQDEIKNLLAIKPEVGGRSFADLLLRSEVSAFPKLNVARIEILGQLKLVSQNYQLFIKDKLNEGLTLGEAQIDGVKTFLNLDKNYSKIKLAQIYTDDGVLPSDAQRMVNIFELASRLIPNKYKKNIPELTLVLKPKDSGSYASSDEKHTVVVLEYHKDLIQQLSIACHEISHLVEKYNPEIQEQTTAFLKSRRKSEELVLLSDLGKKYDKKYKVNQASDLVYDGDFIDPYIGKIYGDLSSGLTEVLSVGAEAMILDPLSFYFRDPEHFYIIYNTFKGNY